MEAAKQEQQPSEAEAQTPEGKTEEKMRTVRAAIVDFVIEPMLRWLCLNPACKQVILSNDKELAKALAEGKVPLVKCAACRTEYHIAKRPERKVLTLDEAQQRPGYNPNLSPAANRILGNVRR